jgi:predicted amidohydrolase YtcJ
VLSLLGPAIATPERTRKGLALVETYLHSSGVTVAAAPTAALSGALRGTQGAAPGDGTRLLRTWLVPAAKTLAGLYPGDPQRMLAQTARIAEWGSGKTGFLPQQVELALDGDPLSRSMRLLKPQREGRDGAWTMDPDTFARVFEAYWDGGYQIQVEARGDGALELLLENLERQMSRRPRYDHRTAVVGLDLAREDQIRRLARLGATVVADPYLATALADRSGELGLSAEQADSLVPLGSAKRAGLPIALQSDLPMAPARPLLLMQSAVSRTTPGGRVAGADQRLAVEDALAAVTINAAYSLRLENEIGSIEPGKLANFTVLEADPLTVPSGQIDTIGVWGTVLEGRVQPVERPSLPARTAQSRPLRTPGIEPGGALAAVR